MADSPWIPVRRALLSVSDKTGLVDFARALARRDVEILSTGGTAKLLAEHGVAVREVSSYTGFPEIMDGRVKTLHPRIHGGLLGRRGTDDAAMALHGIAPIDLLVVNLYPFAETVARPDCRYREAVEHIDIGGPAMLRAAAKNHEFVAVAVDPGDYAVLVRELEEHEGATGLALRSRLAAKAFAHTARYDTMVASFLARQHHSSAERFPATLPLVWEKVQDLRYGENPHQRAAFYRDPSLRGVSIAVARALQGTVRASLKNTAPRAQPLPLLRVVMQDRFGNRIAARDVPPSAYLPVASADRTEIGAGQRVDAEIAFADPGPNAVGFEIDACLKLASGRIACANDAGAPR